MRNSLELVARCSGWKVDRLRTTYTDMCGERAFDIGISEGIAEELNAEAPAANIPATGNMASQECADLLTQVKDVAQMESEGWDDGGVSRKAQVDLDVKHLPDGEELKKVFRAETSDPMKPFSSDSRAELTTLRAAMCFGYP